MFGSILRNSHVLARELKYGLFESTGKTRYVLIVHNYFQTPTAVAASFTIELFPDLIRSLFRKSIQFNIGEFGSNFQEGSE